MMNYWNIFTVIMRPYQSPLLMHSGLDLARWDIPLITTFHQLLPLQYPLTIPLLYLRVLLPLLLTQIVSPINPLPSLRLTQGVNRNPAISTASRTSSPLIGLRGLRPPNRRGTITSSTLITSPPPLNHPP